MPAFDVNLVSGLLVPRALAGLPQVSHSFFECVRASLHLPCHAGYARGQFDNTFTNNLQAFPDSKNTWISQL